MGLSRQYQTYYACDVDYFTHNWATQDYTKILTKDWPDTDATLTVESVTPVTFIYPQMQNAVKIDGVATGVLTVHNTDLVDAKTLNSYTVTLHKINAANASSDLKSYSNSISGGLSIAADDYETLQYWMNIDNKELNTNEKLALTLAITGDTTDLYISHDKDVTNSTIDTWIKIPYI